MKIIPVIDILNEIAVHAVRGIRNQYQPIQSKIVDSAHPLKAAKSLKNLGFKELYIADLDAFIDCSNDFAIHKQIAEETGLSLMVDAGITSLDRAKRLFQTGVSKLVIGTEMLPVKNFIRAAIENFGSNHVIVSLDLKNNKVLSKAETEDSGPFQNLQWFKGMGVKQVIVLDLDRVGSNLGVNMDVLRKTLDLGFKTYVGGGIRDMYDLVELQKMGVSGALIASALHTGKISIDELKHEGFI